jgi:hypothetical protein
MESPSPASEALPRLDAFLALTCAGCGAIHLLVATGEGSGWLAAGVVLGVIGAIQMVLAAALLLGISQARPVTASFSVAVAALWTMSTSAGLPVGPHPWSPETVTAPGIAVTAFELALAFILFALPSRRGAEAPAASPATVAGMAPPRAPTTSAPGWPPPPPAAFEASAVSVASATPGKTAPASRPTLPGPEAPPPPLSPGSFGAPPGRAA